MKLVNFSITNFRSITTAHNIPISNKTVLIGCNNEGKSNVLRALAIAMNALKKHAHKERHRFLLRKPTYFEDDTYDYNWDSDFPAALRMSETSKGSIFGLEFELNVNEQKDLKRKVKCDLCNVVPLEVSLDENNRPSINISEKWSNMKSLRLKSNDVADFVGERVFFNYIPAVRTDKQALSIINDMLKQEMRVFENDEKYKKALKTISNLRKPVLKKLAKKVQNLLKEFLPNIKNVEILMSDDDMLRRPSIRGDLDVLVDDGVLTNIAFKGDGVKSLAALALLKNRADVEGVSIVAIEEPESHLHPGAMNQLNEIICSLSEKNQVILTTHNPLFIDRFDIKSNVIIESGKATPAEHVAQIRELLGIKASDNLINAKYTLVVEGKNDKVALEALLPHLSKKIAKALKEHLLVIRPMDGTSNLNYMLNLLKSELYVSHVLLDNDSEGQGAFEKAQKENLLTIKSCTYAKCPIMKQSEFEDCISLDLYKEKVCLKYGVDLEKSKWAKKKNKWSDHMKSYFIDECSKPWTKDTENELKCLVAEAVSEKPAAALNPDNKLFLINLCKAIEEMINGIN